MLINKGVCGFINVESKYENDINEFILSDKEKVLLTGCDFFNTEVRKYYTLVECGNIDRLLAFYDGQLHLIEKKFGNYYDAQEQSEIKEFPKSSIFIVVKQYLIQSTEQDFIEKVKKRTPKLGYCYIFTMIFIIIVPLYTNVFNTKLIYGDNYLSFFVVSLLFAAFVFFDFYIKYILHASIKNEVAQNILVLDRYLSRISQFVTVKNFPIKVRQIEQSVPQFWELKPMLYTDCASLVLLFLLMWIFLGVYSLILLLYYVVFGVFASYVRFKVYLNVLSSMSAVGEKFQIYSSIYKNRFDLKFLDDNRITSYTNSVFDKNEQNRESISENNYKWGEINRLNSFCSLFFLFTAYFFAVQGNPSLWGTAIAAMIINGRISSLIVSGVNKFFQFRTCENSIHTSSQSIFSVLKKHDNGLRIKEVNKVTFNEFIPKNLSSGKFVNSELIPGNIYCVEGGVGSGKTSLLRCVSGDLEYSGSLVFNNIEASNLSDEFFCDNICFIQSNKDFVFGNLYENFKIHGVDCISDISKILNEVLKGRVIDQDFLFNTDSSELDISSGERQKLLLNMALFNRKKIVLLDEPTSNLSSLEACMIIDKIKKSNLDSIILIATHDPFVVKQADFVIDMGMSKNKFAVKVN